MLISMQIVLKYAKNYFYFSMTITYKAYCSEGYYGADCSSHCDGNPRKCISKGHTYCKMGK